MGTGSTVLEQEEKKKKEKENGGADGYFMRVTVSMMSWLQLWCDKLTWGGVQRAAGEGWST